MNTWLLVASLVCWQETAALARTPQTAAPQVMLDVRVQIIGLKPSLQLPEVVNDPAGFLNDPKTQENLVWSRDLRVSTLAGRDATINVGEDTPIVTGFSTTGNGVKTPNYTRQLTGTIVRLKTSIESADRILLKLAIENSRLDPGKDPEAESALLNTAIRQLIYESEIAVSNGKTKAISFSQSSADANAHSEQALILITATVVAE